MPIPIEDVSRPFRRPRELRHLIEAVRTADDKDESLWLEWKSSLDLTSQPGVLHLVRQILGFANRDPNVAAQWCEGNAYLLVGVSPGRLDGVHGIDHQRLVQTLQPYVGTEIAWTPDYVTVEGREVLVVEIGPPQPGDPIHFLLKDLFITKTVNSGDGPVRKQHGYHHGTILIRRPGTTERADHHERQMLLRRASAAGVRLQTRVIPARTAIETAPALDELLAGFARRERERLLEVRYEPPADREPPRSGFLIAAARSLRVPDPRSLQEYAAEIDAYLNAVQKALRDAVTGDLKDHQPAHLALTLVNRGEQPFTGVEVTVTIPGWGVRCIDPDWETNSQNLDLPDPPAPYGTPRHTTLRGADLNAWHPTAPSAYVSMSMYSNWQAEQHEDSMRIIFNPIDLRARTRVPLEPVPLAIPSGTPGPLAVHWTAAGIDAIGQDSGTIALTLTPSTLPILPEPTNPDEAAASPA